MLVRDSDWKESPRKRVARLETAGGLSVLLPAEVKNWFGWNDGDSLKIFIDVDNKRVMIEKAS